MFRRLLVSVHTAGARAGSGVWALGLYPPRSAFLQSCFLDPSFSKYVSFQVFFFCFLHLKKSNSIYSDVMNLLKA